MNVFYIMTQEISVHDNGENGIPLIISRVKFTILIVTSLNGIIEVLKVLVHLYIKYGNIIR
jgi:hypothetical protein